MKRPEQKIFKFNEMDKSCMAIMVEPCILRSVRSKSYCWKWILFQPLVHACIVFSSLKRYFVTSPQMDFIWYTIHHERCIRSILLLILFFLSVVASIQSLLLLLLLLYCHRQFWTFILHFFLTFLIFHLSLFFLFFVSL